MYKYILKKPSSHNLEDLKGYRNMSIVVLTSLIHDILYRSYLRVLPKMDTPAPSFNRIIVKYESPKYYFMTFLF